MRGEIFFALPQSRCLMLAQYSLNKH